MTKCMEGLSKRCPNNTVENGIFSEFEKKGFKAFSGRYSLPISDLDKDDQMHGLSKQKMSK